MLFSIITQLEPICCFLQIQNNDERILEGILNDDQNNKEIENKFSFENEPFNKNIVKMLFLCHAEKSDQDLGNKFVKKTSFLDNLISSEDYYLQNLKSFFDSHTKAFTLENFKLILEFKSSEFSKFISKDLINYVILVIDSFMNLKEKYKKELDTILFYEESCKLLEDCAEKIKKDIFNLAGVNKYYQQIILYKYLIDNC